MKILPKDRFGPITSAGVILGRVVTIVFSYAVGAYVGLDIIVTFTSGPRDLSDAGFAVSLPGVSPLARAWRDTERNGSRGKVNTMRTVRVGFIGAGQFISASHLATARNSQIMDVAAIADLSPATLDKHRAQNPGATFTTDYRQLLADPSIDLIVIGTRQDLHARLIVECLDAGKWVYCEKPMAETEEEIANVLAAEKRAKGRLAIGLNRRFAPAYAQAKQLMQQAPRPWFISYRLMGPHLTTGEKDDFYRERPRIIYEGCHILDWVCYFLDADPTRVFMTGDRYRNNCCTLEFADGSNVMFLCGSIGSFCLPKEHVEVFAYGRSIRVEDFVDMQVRGFAGERDRQFPLDRGAYASEIERFGFEYYEACRVKEILHNRESMDLIVGKAHMSIEPVIRPVSRQCKEAIDAYGELKPPYFDSPDKGRVHALEHFAKCLLEGAQPDTADGRGGARSTQIGFALLESLKKGMPMKYSA